MTAGRKFSLSIYIIKSGVCVDTTYNVQTLTTPPVSKLWDSQELPTYGFVKT